MRSAAPPSWWLDGGRHPWHRPLASMHALRVGKLAGIDILVERSWVFIFVLMTWNLSSVFCAWHPDWRFFETIGIALTASLLFFACIVLHELAHSIVARRYGLRVRSITLLLFGGVSNLEEEPQSARVEALMALAGPVTSLLLGAAFLALALASTAVSLSDTGTAWSGLAQLGPLVTLLAWLGPLNLGLGAFNLIPAFPLDGGRVLRSILWGLSGDLPRSTRRVAALGQIFGGLFIATGLAITFGVHVPFLDSGVASGLWLAFIGWFLHSAASRSRLTPEEG
jgi:Zn-dependent protease